MSSFVPKGRFYAIILVFALLTLKASLLLASSQQSLCDLAPKRPAVIVERIKETNEGTPLRVGREQATRRGVFSPIKANGAETLSGDGFPGIVFHSACAQILKNSAAEKGISSVPHPNTVSRK